MHIPDAIINAIRLPEEEMETRLKEELATALYGRGLISFGKASELAGTGRKQLAELLEERGIARHHEEEEGEDANSHAAFLEFTRLELRKLIDQEIASHPSLE